MNSFKIHGQRFYDLLSVVSGDRSECENLEGKSGHPPRLVGFHVKEKVSEKSVSLWVRALVGQCSL